MTETVRSLARPFARAVRRVTDRLSGTAELRSQLDRQDTILRGVNEAVLALRLQQAELLQHLAARSAEDRSSHADAELRILDFGLRERLEAVAREQSALRTETAAGLKAAEAALAEALTGEIDRLDGYLLFHTNELRAAVADLHRRLGSNACSSEPPLAKAG